MKKTLTLVGAAILSLTATLVHADAGVDHMKSIIDAVTKSDASQLPAATQRAVATGTESATSSADLSKAPASTTQFAVAQSAKWEQMAREAYVAALPPRDQAVGRSILLGDGTLPGSNGKLYIFVSRSMPMSLLRAYSVEALYTGATLVVKGIRKGDSINQYIEEAVADFNSAEGQVLAGIEVNPNLFDMFNVNVVPSVVWTNRVGLDDIGSGCPNLPEGAKVEQVTLEGPNNSFVTVDKPTCAPVPQTAYYKLTGALAMPYVFDRFQEAGAPKDAMDQYRQQLAERRANATDGTVRAAVGNAMTPLPEDIKLGILPKYVLRYWSRMLSKMNVQRGPYGPSFSGDGEDDADYRRELTAKVEHGLGL